jgi:hypothetical protein
MMDEKRAVNDLLDALDESIARNVPSHLWGDSRIGEMCRQFAFELHERDPAAYPDPQKFADQLTRGVRARIAARLIPIR